MKLRLTVAAGALLLLGACSTTPHQGHITGKHMTPGYMHHWTWSSTTCQIPTMTKVGKTFVSGCALYHTTVYHDHDWVPARYYLHLVNSKHQGYLSVDASTYSRYQSGSYYP